jgi:hypothetical protein
MSSGRPGLWQRNSGAAATETQENLLAHPMVRIQKQNSVKGTISYVTIELARRAFVRMEP